MPALSGSEKALMYSLSGVLRSGAGRSDYYPPIAAFSLATVNISRHVVKGSVRITDLADEAPNTAVMQVRGGTITPVKGQEIIVGIGNITNKLFAGNVLQVRERARWKNQKFTTFELECVDYTWQLDWKRVEAMSFTNVDVATILSTLISNFAPAFSVGRVSAGMGSIDLQSNSEELLSTVINRAMKAVGGYWYVDYDKVLHAYQSYETDNAPTDLTSTNSNFWDFIYSEDISQVRTRVKVVGGSSTTTATVAIGATSIPVDDTRLFASGGGTVLLGANKITYSAKSVATGAGNLTGVPGSGAGSVTVAVAQGETVRVLRQAQDATAAAALATLLGTGDGYVEHLIEDGQAGDDAAGDRASGDLALYKNADAQIAYGTRDKFARSGKAVTVNLTNTVNSRSVSGSFLIQQVVISEIEVAMTKHPLREVQAGTNRRDLYDLLRKLTN